MTFNELEKQSDEQLQALYNSEYNINRRKAETAYNDVCNEIQEINRQIDECVKNLDYDNAVCLEEKLANLEARQKTLKRVLDNFSLEPIYHHDDIVKICDAIDAERGKYAQNESGKLYQRIEEILALMDDIEINENEYRDLAAECYKKSPMYKDCFSNPYRVTKSSNYTYVKEYIKEALISLEPFLKKD